MRRTTLALLLCIALCLSLAAPALAAESDFTIRDGVLKKYNGPGGDVVIPDGVTRIEWYAFKNCTGLTSVTIPDGVTCIGTWAFLDCTSLTSIAIPNSVTIVGDSAFQNCTSLTSITIPDGITLIGNRVFQNCTNLTSFTIPDSVTYIDHHAFAECESLTSITIPEGVTHIRYHVFSECESLTDVYYGGSPEQWAQIEIDDKEDGNAPLHSATIHYNSTAAGTSGSSARPAAPANTAYASTQSVDVDGNLITFECYALKDENGDLTNYIKLRDLAILLNSTAAQFQVGWDGQVTITTGTAYTPDGSELRTPFSGDRAYQLANAATRVDGKAADLSAFVLYDDAGGGYTYYQLRDLGQALGFNVGWTARRGMFIETDRPYDANN